MSRKEVENKQKRSVNSRLKSRACTYATVNDSDELDVNDTIILDGKELPEE